NFLKAASNSNKALASFCLRFNNPSFRAMLPECTSNGQERAAGEIDFQIPKSTPALSFLTIHRKNILMRLAAEFFKGSLICFWVLCKWSISKKIDLNFEMAVCKVSVWACLANTDSK